MEDDKNVTAPDCEFEPRASILSRAVRRIFQLAVATILLLATLTPLLELCDSWDKGVVPATDTELRVTATFSCAGLLAAVVLLMRWVPAPLRVANHCIDALKARQPGHQSTAEPIEPTGSPPLPLPLRI